MNQQMYLLEARALARDRERRLQLNLRGGAASHRRARRSSARRLVGLSLGRDRAARATRGSGGVVAARG